MLSRATWTDASFEFKIVQLCVSGGILNFKLWFQVKDAKLEKFRAIASEPKDKNAFKIENYDGLKGVLENFQKKIFQMEGEFQLCIFLTFVQYCFYNEELMYFYV